MLCINRNILVIIRILEKYQLFIVLLLYYLAGHAYETLKDADKRKTYDLQTDRPTSARPQPTYNTHTKKTNSTGNTKGYTFFNNDSFTGKPKTNNPGTWSSFSFTGKFYLAMYLRICLCIC